MGMTIKICTVLFFLLSTLFISGCAGLVTDSPMAPAEARVALKRSFVSALSDEGDVIGVAIYKDEVAKYIDARPIGNSGVIYLYKNDGKERFAYALLNFHPETQIDSFRKEATENSEYKWGVKFNGDDAGWATGYTDKEPFFSMTTAELNDRHKQNHKSVLWFKSKDNMELFLKALSSLFPNLTF